MQNRMVLTQNLGNPQMYLDYWQQSKEARLRLSDNLPKTDISTPK